jgi:hypothetical protein
MWLKRVISVEDLAHGHMRKGLGGSWSAGIGDQERTTYSLSQIL